MDLQEALRQLEHPAKSRYSASKYDFVKVRALASLFEHIPALKQRSVCWCFLSKAKKELRPIQTSFHNTRV